MYIYYIIYDIHKDDDEKHIICVRNFFFLSYRWMEKYKITGHINTYIGGDEIDDQRDRGKEKTVYLYIYICIVFSISLYKRACIFFIQL